MTPQAPPSALTSRRILIVEDEYFLADDMTRALEKVGVHVLGPVGELADALDLLAREESIDAAVIDVNLRSKMAFPISTELRSRRIPFVFVTGYDKEALPIEFRDAILFGKPVDPPAVIRALSRILKAGQETLPS